jgi:hypothetical protein
MDDGVHELPDNVRTGLSDTKLYLSNTEEVISNAAQIDGCVRAYLTIYAFFLIL